MIYDNHLPDSATSVQVFHAQGEATDWYSWNKPHNCKFVHIFCLGGGGGGGSGSGAAAALSRRGGGGGGSSGFTTGFFSAAFLPDTIYLQVGKGGAGGSGGSSNTSGSAGPLSYVSISPTASVPQNILLQSGAAPAGPGVYGGGLGGGGAAGTIWTASATNILITGLIVPVAGQVGGTGQTNPTPTNITVAGLTTGGAPGAGLGSIGQQGGSILGTGSVPTVIGGAAGGSSNNTTPGGDGSSYYATYPSSTNYVTDNLFFSGGSGGGSSDGGVAGNGGAAAFGAGGGGGGCGITGFGGRGGRGGNGLIIITCF